MDTGTKSGGCSEVRSKEHTWCIRAMPAIPYISALRPRGEHPKHGKIKSAAAQTHIRAVLLSAPKLEELLTSPCPSIEQYGRAQIHNYSNSLSDPLSRLRPYIVIWVFLGACAVGATGTTSSALVDPSPFSISLSSEDDSAPKKSSFGRSSLDFSATPLAWFLPTMLGVDTETTETTDRLPPGPVSLYRCRASPALLLILQTLRRHNLPWYRVLSYDFVHRPPSSPEVSGSSSSTGFTLSSPTLMRALMKERIWARSAAVQDEGSASKRAESGQHDGTGEARRKSQNEEKADEEERRREGAVSL